MLNLSLLCVWRRQVICGTLIQAHLTVAGSARKFIASMVRYLLSIRIMSGISTLRSRLNARDRLRDDSEAMALPTTSICFLHSRHTTENTMSVNMREARSSGGAPDLAMPNPGLCVDDREGLHSRMDEEEEKYVHG